MSAKSIDRVRAQQLDKTRRVMVVAFKDGAFGLEFVNAGGVMTRALLSDEAAKDLRGCLNTILDGGGSPAPQPEWRHIPNPETLVRDDEP